MSEVEKKKTTWKLNAVFVVATALVITLGISSLWLLLRTDFLQTQVGNLQKENNSFQSSIGSLQTEVSNLTSVKTDLQSKVDDLTDNNTDLQSQVDTLTQNNAYLNNEVDDLNGEIYDLESEIWDLEWEIILLEEPQLHKVGVYWNDNHPLFSSPYVNIHGYIFNSGSWTAYNVVSTVRIYDAYDTLLKTEEIHLGNIYGKSYESFDVDIGYSGDAYTVYSTLDWD